jgi:hypothetical protein
MNIPNGRYIMGVDLAKAGDQLVLVPMRRNVPVFQQAIAVSNDEFSDFMRDRDRSRKSPPPPSKND